MDLERYINIAQDFIVTYGIKVIGAIVIWIIGSWLIKKVNNGIAKIMTKQNYEISLQKFLLT